MPDEIKSQRLYKAALDLLENLLDHGCPQSGPGPRDRDVNREVLTDLCRQAETLLYEARGRY